MSTIIYLYIKTHNKTGLKYLGKTTKKDQHKYKGSGKYWLKHIKKHGYDVTTEIIFETKDKQEFEVISEFFSNLFDIVNDKNWANLCIENGKGGSLFKEKNGMYGKTHTSKVKYKLSGLAKDRFKGKTYEEIYGKEKAEHLKKLRSKKGKNKNNKGEYNSRFDRKKYQFLNIKTKEMFIGTRYDFYKQNNYPKSSVHKLIHNNNFVYRNWILLNPELHI